MANPDQTGRFLFLVIQNIPGKESRRDEPTSGPELTTRHTEDYYFYRPDCQKKQTKNRNNKL